ncbi:MAG: hypothetical protein EZS26_001803 [Candidatus Ordinivivax streblomastigis]|uniref:Nucleotidyl transferase AbiEii/AbiGii toxin family protein n=1 Tax=Candidatus Ordinivivax streblomastigis TaxID=2540710 RepID=A0A5M8P0N3_9BACT|nr:MAG: hypothetical protein EZS26_001803 [Candidatus Ordinivivax streblomastigis]
MERSLPEKTRAILNQIAAMECIRPYVLVGGTALSLQLKHRLSEDLDFMKFKKHKMDKTEVETGQISRELEKNGIDIQAIY